MNFVEEQQEKAIQTIKELNDAYKEGGDSDRANLPQPVYKIVSDTIRATAKEIYYSDKAKKKDSKALELMNNKCGELISQTKGGEKEEEIPVIDDIHLGEIFSGDLERNAEEISSVKGIHSVPAAHV